MPILRCRVLCLELKGIERCGEDDMMWEVKVPNVSGANLNVAQPRQNWPNSLAGLVDEAQADKESRGRFMLQILHRSLAAAAFRLG